MDEVGDLPLELQPKILRALQEKEFERVGGTRTIPVNVRLVAATNRDLAKMVSAGQFRSDLYYRLRVFPVTIPPLRERRDDIPVLVRYFLSIHSKRMGRRIETIPAETMKTLVNWHWPGNVRELENFIERSVILSPGPVLRAPLAELEAVEESAEPTDSNLEVAEREHILRVLRRMQRNDRRHERRGGTARVEAYHAELQAKKARDQATRLHLVSRRNLVSSPGDPTARRTHPLHLPPS